MKGSTPPPWGCLLLYPGVLRRRQSNFKKINSETQKRKATAKDHPAYTSIWVVDYCLNLQKTTVFEGKATSSVVFATSKRKRRKRELVATSGGISNCLTSTLYLSVNVYLCLWYGDWNILCFSEFLGSNSPETIYQFYTSVIMTFSSLVAAAGKHLKRATLRARRTFPGSALGRGILAASRINARREAEIGWLHKLLRVNCHQHPAASMRKSPASLDPAPLV